MGSCVSPGELACCHGYTVTGADVEIGSVETPIFLGPTREPEFILVRTSGAISGTFRVVPSGIVAEIDRDGRRIAITADAAAIARLPERLLPGRFVQ